MTRKKKQRPTDPDDKLLEQIIRLNTAVMNDTGVACPTCERESFDADTRFKAQDRILKALALKARKGKQGGSKFDLGDSAADDE